MLAFEGDSEVVWFEGNYQAYIEDLKKRKGADADSRIGLRTGSWCTDSGRALPSRPVGRSICHLNFPETSCGRSPGLA